MHHMVKAHAEELLHMVIVESIKNLAAHLSSADQAHVAQSA